MLANDFELNQFTTIYSTLITCTDKGTVTFWPEGVEKVSKVLRACCRLRFVGGNLHG